MGEWNCHKWQNIFMTHKGIKVKIHLKSKQ
jgi:hypothetical protein